MKLNIGIPTSEYDLMNLTTSCTEVAREAISGFLSTTSYERILLFGGASTGDAVKACMDNRFAGFIDSASIAGMRGNEGDCVVITTAPIHADIVEQTLAASPLSGLPVIGLFSAKQLDIRLILETQPRSGTDYTIRNIQDSFGLGYASVFRLEDGEATPDGRVMFRSQECRGYVVKAHFTKTLHFPQYRYCPTLFLVGYFADTYYRWARMLADVRSEDRESYFLRADSPEWNRVRGHIPLHLEWLDYIRDRDFFRYEDYFHDFDGVMSILKNKLGEKPASFELPRLIGNRIYWTGDYENLMDKAVWRELWRAFESHLRYYYPEKMEAYR